MDETPVPLPSAAAVTLAPNITLQPPLSRRGHGPGLLLVLPADYEEYKSRNETLDPDPRQKWAEEGYAVVQITGHDEDLAIAFKRGLDALVELPECDVKDKFGLIVYGSTRDYNPKFGESLHDSLAAHQSQIVAIITYDEWNLPESIPTLLHLPGKRDKPAGQKKKQDDDGDSQSIYTYPEATSAGFIVPGHPDFRLSSAGVAHTRTLTFLKKHMNGPYFDLEKIWEEHTSFEFANRSVEKTMGTMVQEPYVNHIPTITGGIGRTSLSNFYRNHFIFNNPEDTELELISRTVGVDRIVDEFIFSLTHTKEIDWLLPGIPPTNKHLRIPFTAVVNIRGDRLYHEHISWDQATVLVQLGLLPEYLPFPYPLPNGQVPGEGKRFEYRVPAAGVETALKMKDEKAVPSNEMMGFKIREVDGD
ncbi:hypothetical protein VTN96DRAFT_1169 [Rasamsonia emersonii]|uniref:Carboxymethylenebutenolidase n=1 Tax=Rasamsonia emersonii (strain ATCC 16479 / CBS 393.64 / IMI 116815) TaxID=1408163 RepID=A0A0F4YPK9_RASE3|nr:hypothetical protein T310_5823 [Rasamsonia emersonii CBS 393.64]KKA20169.1 hypothetical protein T310_5823 [Rasamsonia emersonii CBS 393.64]